MSNDANGSRRAFALELSAGSFGAAELTVTRAHGREKISGLYSFVVSVTTDLEPAKMAALLNAPARLSLGEAGQLRCYSGMVDAVSSAGSCGNQHDRQRAFVIRLVPRASRLRHRKDSRIFQFMKLEEVVAAVLDPLGIPHRWQRTHESVLRDYVTQYEETDYAFVQRLVAEAGIFYYFEQAPAPHEESPNPDQQPGETVVFCDDVNAYPNIEGDPTLRLREAAQMIHDDDTMHRFGTSVGVRSDASTFRDYDPFRPGMELRATSKTRRDGGGDSKNAFEIYEHDGRHAAVQWEHDQERAELRLSRARRSASVGSGRSSCARLTAGHKFRLEDERNGGEFDGEYMVTQVTHHGAAVTAEQASSYSCSLRCVPSRVPYLPIPRPRAKIHSCLTATVVGPVSEEIFVNAVGEIKVQFHWDRAGARDEHSSCWIRCMQPWAGSQWGAQFTPRVGMEVVVGFDGGDANKPVVLGTIQNGTHAVPFSLKEKTKSGIVTKTYGGVGSNSLVFEDARGKEEIEIRGQRDVSISSANDYQLAIGGRATTDVKGNYSLSVKGAQNETINGLRSSVVNGSRIEVTTGLSTSTVAGDAMQEVKGDYNLKGRQRVSIAAETGMSISVGTMAKKSESQVFVHGTSTIGASDTVQINAAKGLVLLCGTSSLKILPDRIELRTDTLVLKAAKSIAASTGDNGPSLVIDEQATLKSKKVSVLAEQATLEMDDQGVKLHGNQVQIDCAPERPPEPKTDEEKAETKKMIVQLTDARLKPLANMKYHVQVSGKRLEGTTDADGVVEQTVPISAQLATVTVWLSDYPTGPQNQYEIELVAAMPPPDTVHGAKLRLRNLGYYKGPIDDAQSGAFRDALVLLQVDFGLARTGKLDSDTLGQLERVHTS